MTTLFVHRNLGPGTPISYAGPQQPGYADEPLDSATSTELQAFLAPPAPTSLAQLVVYNEYMLLMLIELINNLLTKPATTGAPIITPAMFSATSQAAYTKAKALLTQALTQIPAPP
jgi:hypothetical protein